MKTEAKNFQYRNSLNIFRSWFYPGYICKRVAKNVKKLIKACRARYLWYFWTTLRTAYRQGRSDLCYCLWTSVIFHIISGMDLVSRNVKWIMYQAMVLRLKNAFSQNQYLEISVQMNIWKIPRPLLFNFIIVFATLKSDYNKLLYYTHGFMH